MAAKDTLVKYDNPQQVLVAAGAKDKKGTNKFANTALKSQRVGKLPSIDKNATQMQANQQQAATEEILNSIIPPREWNEDGLSWLQKVSSTPATRLDVINLQEQLDQRLQARKARETGICPVRRDLYDQTLDEIIREVTINCMERGLLLLRVRDELRMTIAAYQTLYESSIAFGIRKALDAEQGKSDMVAKLTQTEEEKKDLERQVQELKAKIEFIEKRENERRAQEEKKHAEEVAFLKRTNVQLKTQLESILKKN